MELFVVNRYTGNDVVPDDASKESQLRENCLEKVRLRKKLLKQSKDSKCELFNDSGTSPPDGDKSVDDSCEALQIGDDASEKKKKKKKKSKSGEPMCKLLNDSETYPSDDNNKSADDGCESLEIGDDSLEMKKRKRKKSRSDEGRQEVSPKQKEKRKRANELNGEERNNSDNENNDDNNNISEKLDSQTGAEPFSILGSDSFIKPKKVKRPIPEWLANPSIVSVDLKNLDTQVDAISDLDDIFRKKLKENGITHFFPVQTQIIPWLLESIKKPDFYWPNDICVSAPTGSGKTLAFVLPVLQALQNRIVPYIRAIVILPVHDLAIQVYRVFQEYSKPTKLKVLLLSKQQPFSEEQAMINEKDIIVTTAGRLVDHLMNTDGMNLRHVRFLVIDEADRVMEDMQNDWLYHLNKKIQLDSSKSYQTPVLTYKTLTTKQRPPQKLLFSATLSQDPEKLQQLGLFQPKLFTSVVAANSNEEHVSTERFIGKFTTPAELEECYALSTAAEKPVIIHHLLVSEGWKGVLCFVNTVETVKRLSNLLRKMNTKLRIRSISAKLIPTKRDAIMNDFARGKIDMLISSDALTRGMDIPNVKYVISYSLPKYLKTYIHRIGRTGRAGREGLSLILLIDKEVSKFRNMMEESGKKSVREMTFEEDKLEQYTEAYEAALGKLKSGIEKGKAFTLTKIKSIKSKNRNVKRKKLTTVGNNKLRS